MTEVIPVVFDFPTWTGIYPEFSNCTSMQGQNWFTRATLLCDNSACNPAASVSGSLTALLYMLTSHLAWLNAPRDPQGNPTATGSPPPSTVGRVTSASEGSVSAGIDGMAEMNAAFPSAAWYLTTQYGAEYVAASAVFRTATYVPGPCRYFGTVYTSNPYGGW